MFSTAGRTVKSGLVASAVVRFVTPPKLESQKSPNPGQQFVDLGSDPASILVGGV
jgi:hypothetical protein